jgi:hypothetical protein
MELRYAHLADFASADASAKITLVGIFDLVFDRVGARPVLFPPCYLAASFAASMAEGSAHTLEITVVDADEHQVFPPIRADLPFVSSGPGNPLRAQVIMGFGPGALRVPEPGDYLITFVVDGTRLGAVPITVRNPEPGP